MNIQELLYLLTPAPLCIMTERAVLVSQPFNTSAGNAVAQFFVHRLRRSRRQFLSPARRNDGEETMRQVGRKHLLVGMKLLIAPVRRLFHPHPEWIVEF